jgi:hypothetical protein
MNVVVIIIRARARRLGLSRVATVINHRQPAH